MSEEIEVENEAVEIEVEAAEPSPDEIEARKEVEDNARKYGWRPKEDFDLAPDGWVDADRFMEFPATQLKMSRDQIAEQNAKLERFEQEAAEARRDALRAARSVESLVEQKTRERLEQIQREQREAVETGDVERFDRLERDKGQAVQQSAPAPTEDVVQYEKDNPWTQNPILRQQGAQMIDAAGLRNRPPIKQLEYVEGEMRKMYPSYFPAPEPAPARDTETRAARVDSGGLGGNFRQGKGASDLPPEAVREGTEFVKDGIFKSLDEYAKSYHEEGQS